MAIAHCPDCGRAIRIGGEPKVGVRLHCPACRTELEIVESHPVELDWVISSASWDDDEDDWDDEDEDEDWDDDDEDWDDDDEDWDDDDWDDDDLEEEDE